VKQSVKGLDFDCINVYSLPVYFLSSSMKELNSCFAAPKRILKSLRGTYVSKENANQDNTRERLVDYCNYVL